MRQFGRLIINEHIKIYTKISTWVMIALVLLAVIGGGLGVKLLMDHDTPDGWRKEVTEHNTQIKQILAEGNPSEADKLIMDRQLAINEYRITHDIPPIDYSIDNLLAFVKITSEGIPSMVDLVTLVTIIIAAGIVASEFSSGAIKLLLIRPISRSMILLSKYVTVLTFAFTLLLALFIFSLLTGGILFGFNGISDPQLIYSNGEVVEKSMFLHVLQAYGLTTIRLVMLTTIAFLVSAVFRSSSMAIGLSLFLLFSGTQVVFMLKKFEWAKYLLFANTDLNMYINERPFQTGMTLPFSLAVLAIHYICFIFLSWYIFRTRDVSN
ncbi:MAG: transporter family protein [Paenibacillus sp.]|jgi:ABC-2 type transport system permease protein|nr:transporter family protein [Paenibacillus sp.]